MGDLALDAGALDAGVDPVSTIGSLRRAHERFLTSGETPAGMRPVVATSWLRSVRAGVDPHRHRAPVQLVDDDLREYRDRHPLAAVLPMFRTLLGRIAGEARHLMVVADADGRLLWVEGHAALRRGAERMNFVEGAEWDERRVGTNAPGTALATGKAVQIFAAEHFSSIVQPWTCAAAPVRDPETREVLGVIDITGGNYLGGPSSLALVQATALAAEGELLRLRGSIPQPDDAQPDETGPEDGGRLEVLGRDEGILTVGGRQRRLSRRHSEILTILVQRPEGLSGEQLGLELYGDEANPITLRAEIVRLRGLLGPGVLGSRPYRLLSPVSADFADVLRLLEQNSVGAALRRYRGPLLPTSEAPGIEHTRRRIEQRVRAGVIASADPDLLTQWTSTPWGAEDLELWEKLVRVAPAGATRTLAQAEVRRLTAEYAVPARPRPAFRRQILPQPMELGRRT
jgi:hypothetical protein